ncbi:hypothetical protein NXW09_28515 [Bacteroides ovatus]|nr:hypothetical protein [Bacteroides ovatus]
MATAIRQTGLVAVNSLCSEAKNVIDVATPEIPQGVERWSDLDRLNRERTWLVSIFPLIRWMNFPLCWNTFAILV